VSATVEAAWIAASSGFLGIIVGVGGTVTVAIFGLHSTRKATDAQITARSTDIKDQIEADRRNRVWERQAAVYIDVIAAILHREKVRRLRVEGMITGTEPDIPPAPVDWSELGVRLYAYASPEVHDAFLAAEAACEPIESAIRKWLDERKHQRVGPAQEEAKKAVKEANSLDNGTLAIIRGELHASPVRAPGPAQSTAPESPGAS
jgi:hypothetical protein